MRRKILTGVPRKVLTVKMQMPRGKLQNPVTYQLAEETHKPGGGSGFDLVGLHRSPRIYDASTDYRGRDPSK